MKTPAGSARLSGREGRDGSLASSGSHCARRLPGLRLVGETSGAAFAQDLVKCPLVLPGFP